jgi:hypothetical protein
MPTNGTRRPPRPKIELVTEPGSETEAAAIVAALEQFLAETAPAPPVAGPAQSPWQRAALREAISARTEHGPASGVLKAGPRTLKATNRRREWP